jgi:hypothetical protein
LEWTLQVELKGSSQRRRTGRRKQRQKGVQATKLSQHHVLQPTTERCFCHQCKTSAHVEDQKQVQRDFSTNHGVFKKFWELVSCHKYKGSSGYGLQIPDFMPPSPNFVANEKEYNRWKEMATKLGSTPQMAAQRAEYKKKLFEDGVLLGSGEFH